MSDPNRKLVDILAIHHSCGPRLKDAPILKVQNWYDDCGKGWGYANYCREHKLNVNDYDTHHKHPRLNKWTYAQAQYALHEFKGKWRLVILMDDPFGCVAWGMDRGGKWDSRAINVEVCGDYHNDVLPLEALQALVDGFIDHYKALKAKGITMRIDGHCAFGKTECPGRIASQMPALRDLFDRSAAVSEML